MSKRTVYLIALILAVVVILLIGKPNQTVVVNDPTASPSNGMTGGTTADAVTKPVETIPAPEATAPAPTDVQPSLTPPPGMENTPAIPPAEGGR